jgi:hypothetical protein
LLLLFSDRVEAANQKDQAAITSNEKKPSNLRRTDTSTSMASKLVQEKTIKRISFQGDNLNHCINVESPIQDANEAKDSSDWEGNKIHQINEECTEDLPRSSISSQSLSYNSCN